MNLRSWQRSSSLRGGVAPLIAAFAAFVLAGCCYTQGNACDPCAPACPPSSQCGPLPAEAKPGEAWCCVFVPPVYEDVECQVCVCPASCTREWIEPVYEEQQREVCVRPASTRRIDVPGEWRDETQEILVCPARTEWKRVECTPEQLAAGERQGECWMMVEVPPVYRTVTRRVCVTPPSCRMETVPPVYETVTERVCVKPGSWREVPVPARYETRTTKRMVSPCRWEWRRNESCDVVPGPAETDDAGGMP
jgi:hypothetical protein